jgi:hypothetical protein
LQQYPIIIEGRHALETELRHETGEQVVSRMLLPVAPDAGAKALGSALTYARRYALLAVLALAPDEDDDGAAAQPQTQAETAHKAADGPSRAQHARLAVLLKELEELAPKAEGQQSYVEDARAYIGARFAKQSRTQLTVSEMQDLIDAVEGWRRTLDIPFGSEMPA